MVNKPGYSFGPDYPIHYDRAEDGSWYVFDARDNKLLAEGLKEWEARDAAYKLNGAPAVDLTGIDGTP